MSQRVELMIAAYLGNPFEGDPSSRREAEQAFDPAAVGAALGEAVNAGRHEEVERLVLAAGHLEAIASPENPKRVLQPPTLPLGLFSKLPRPRGEYLRVVMAAGRAHLALQRILGESPGMCRVRREVWGACFGKTLRHALHLERVIRDDDIVITGETGTGKESVAAAVQQATFGDPDGSPAPAGSINAAALPDTLVESELFGYVKGAFTGARESRVGRIRASHGGSFFLDEVGDLPQTTQVKLLRVIEGDEIAPLGADIVHHVDVRFVAATHRDLEQMVEAGEFRRDLFQRLAGNVIDVPPLRERPEDVAVIGRAFVAEHLDGVSLPEVREALDGWLSSKAPRAYSWPGNVRELQNVLRSRMLGMEPPLNGVAPLSVDDQEALPERIRACAAPLEDVEMWYLRRVLSHTEQNFAQTARILGVDRSTVRRRFKHHEGGQR